MVTPDVLLNDVEVTYRSAPALHGVSLSLGRGVNGVLGVNGAGKTTLLRIIATALAPTSGSTQLLGFDPSTSDGRLNIRRRLGYVPQDPGLFPKFTVYDLVDYVAILKEITSTAQRRREVRRVLADVDLEATAHHRIGTLSGGMRARFSIAQALLGDPQLLVLDEPTAGLDALQRLHFRQLLGSLGRDRTVLLSTHLAEDVAALCARVTVLHHGRVIFDASPGDLAARAQGRVWEERATTSTGAVLVSWRTGNGWRRCIGDPPRGAALVEPTLEDGYLLLTEAAGEGR